MIILYWRSFLGHLSSSDLTPLSVILLNESRRRSLSLRMVSWYLFNSLSLNMRMNAAIVLNTFELPSHMVLERSNGHHQCNRTDIKRLLTLLN